jgi:regulator of RNase E activity RraA
MSEEYLKRLGAIDCCALSDALDRLGLTGQVTGLPQMSGTCRIVGRAITVRLGAGEPGDGRPRHLCTTAIEAGGQENIIVVEQRTGIEAGCWGGLLTIGAMQRGIAGVVADGPVRDIDQARGYGFPIFTSRTTSFTARGRVVEKETNGPVLIGVVTVNPGDYVVADNSAIIFISAENVEAVLLAAEDIVARERAMAAAIRDGNAIGAVMGGDYESMLEARPA